MKKLLLLPLMLSAAAAVGASGPDYGTSNRPEASERLFTSQAVERQIERIRQTVTVPKLAWMFENCFPNTLDTTVHYRQDEEGEDDTFVYTGDIHAMWLRDSGAQVWPYLPLAREDEAMRLVLKTLRDQQRREGPGAYRFQRVTEDALDTQLKNGYGHPARPVGLIASSFRPSDDATTFPFLIPSNFFAVSSLRKAAEILRTVNRDETLASACETLADEVEQALKKHAVCDHPQFGKIYAFETDGFGNRLLMDDANVPSLLAMTYLGDIAQDDPVYRNTRRFVWSESNPYFFRGTAAEGIGGPHIGADMIWPMSLIMRALTSDDDAEIKRCVETLVNTDGGTGFMHESFHKDDPSNFTRPWFAWANTLFGELILRLADEGKTDLLNSIEVR